MQQNKAIREEIVEIARRAFAQQLFAGTSGNLSVYSPEMERVFITPSGLRYESMVAADIVEVDLAGERLQGKHRPSSERLLHCQIYRDKPEVRSVFHTHSPYATAFAVVQRPIPLVLLEMMYFLGGDVPCAAIQMPGTAAVGESAVAALQERSACLLANHGVVAIGQSAAQAHLRAEYVEDAAKTALLAGQLGTIKEIPSAFVQKIAAQMKKG